ncbi:MAG TPA: hypothetical protein VHZ50_07410 [Puia sp.]|nr:hypothetical protein [Puia sp.]
MIQINKQLAANANRATVQNRGTVDSPPVKTQINLAAAVVGFVNSITNSKCKTKLLARLTGMYI